MTPQHGDRCDVTLCYICPSVNWPAVVPRCGWCSESSMNPSSRPHTTPSTVTTTTEMTASSLRCPVTSSSARREHQLTTAHLSSLPWRPRRFTHPVADWQHHTHVTQHCALSAGALTNLTTHCTMPPASRPVIVLPGLMFSFCTPHVLTRRRVLSHLDKTLNAMYG